jgi:hypothetical protein
MESELIEVLNVVERSTKDMSTILTSPKISRKKNGGQSMPYARNFWTKDFRPGSRSQAKLSARRNFKELFAMPS